MSVYTYSLAKDGDRQLSTNFVVKEFRCFDNSDKILVDSELAKILQKVRDHFGKPIEITSGYRTAAHNKKIGGASNSQHLYGKAADFHISGVAPIEICKYLEQIGAHGLGCYSSWVHVDTREGKSYWDQRNGTYKSVSTFGAVSFAKIVKDKAGLGDATITYLEAYQYGADLIEKLAAAMK